MPELKLVEKLTFGSNTVELRGTDFLKLVNRLELTTIHAQIKQGHVYVTADGGFTLLALAKEALQDYNADFEATNVKSYSISTKEAAAGFLANLFTGYGDRFSNERTSCEPGIINWVLPNTFQKLAPKMNYIVQWGEKELRKDYGYLGTLNDDMSYVTIAESQLNIKPHFKAIEVQLNLASNLLYFLDKRKKMKVGVG